MKTLSPSEKKAFGRSCDKIVRAAATVPLALLLGLASPGAAGALGLREAVQKALKSDRAISVARDQARLASARILGLESLYDPAATAAFSHTDAMTPRQIVFQAGRTFTDAGSMGLEKGWALGAKASAEVSWDKTRDDSAFSTFPTRHTAAVNLAVTQPLLKGLVGQPGRKALRSAELHERAAWASFLRQAEHTAAAAARAYWTAWKSSRAAQIAWTALVDSDSFLEHTRMLKKMGLREEDDVFQAEAAYLTRRAEAVTSVTRFEDAADGLVHLMDGRVPLAGGAPAMDSPGLSADRESGAEGAYRNALGGRKDIEAAALSIESLRLEKEGLEGEELPSLDVNAAMGFQGLHRNADRAFSNTFTGDFPTWSAGLSLRYPFGGREAEAELESVSARLATARTQREDLVSETALGLRRSLRRLKSAAERFGLMRAAVSAEEAAYGFSSKKYNQGRISSREILLSQDRLRGARLGSLDAEEAVSLALIDLKLSEGTLLRFLGVSLE